MAWDRLYDSYHHYRTKVGWGPGHAVYRALYYTLWHKEPPQRYMSFKYWLEARWHVSLCYHNWCWRRWVYQYRCHRHQDDP